MDFVRAHILILCRGFNLSAASLQGMCSIFFLIYWKIFLHLVKWETTRKTGFDHLNFAVSRMSIPSIPIKKCMNINVNYLWNQWKSNEIMVQQLSLQNHKLLTKLKHCLNVPKTQNTTNSKTWLLVSSQIIPKVSLIKSKTFLEMIQDTQASPTRYPSISH